MDTKIDDVKKAVETIRDFCDDFNKTHIDNMASRNKIVVAKSSHDFELVNKIEKLLIGIEDCLSSLALYK